MPVTPGNGSGAGQALTGSGTWDTLFTAPVGRGARVFTYCADTAASRVRVTWSDGRSVDVSIGTGGTLPFYGLPRGNGLITLVEGLGVGASAAARWAVQGW